MLHLTKEEVATACTALGVQTRGGAGSAGARKQKAGWFSAIFESDNTQHDGEVPEVSGLYA